MLSANKQGEGVSTSPEPDVPPKLPVNVASYLPAMARERPNAPAVLFPKGTDASGNTQYIDWTFRQLDEESNRLARGLEAIGIDAGVRTVLMVKPSLEFFALTFALFKVGAVPVLVDPGMGIRSLGRCLAEAEPEAFIGIPKAQTARVLLGWAKQTIRHIVTVGRRWFWGGYTLEQVRQAGAGSLADKPVTSDQPAAILFTSGSTGPPKGAVYTHGIFTAQVEMLRRTYGIQSGEIDLCTFPLFALFAPALGMTSIIPEMDATRPALVEPGNIIGPIERFGVTNMFGSPALLRRVAASPLLQAPRIASLRRVISAGAPASPSVLQQWAQVLPDGAQVFTPYGATEALPVCSIGSSELLLETRARTAEGGGICVGRPMDGARVAIIRISDEPIPTWSEDLLVPTGDIGEIVVQGPMVTREYYHRPDATRLAKIADPERGTFSHRMGDVGYFDEQGRLWFCGRKSQRVIAAEGTLFTIPCEAIFNAHPKVLRTALVGVGPSGVARPVLCVELKDNERRADREQVRRELLALGAGRPHTRSIATILFHRYFPVDIRHNAKIFREKLAVWAARQLR
jgi:acyl-CoA synthetase (AMP-forming)/AMP-acid ligase II